MLKRCRRSKDNTSLTNIFYDAICVLLIQLMAHWKELKRSLRKLDAQRGGYVTTGEFKACLSNVGVTLNDDEQYGLLTSYDTDVTGKVAYNRFLVDLTMDKLPAGVGLLSRSATTLL